MDVKRAIAWTKAGIADHGGDPGFLAITGGSAGGHLSSLAAPTPPTWLPTSPASRTPTPISAAVLFYGVYDMTDAAGTGNRGLVPLLARRVFKTRSTTTAPRELGSPITHTGPGRRRSSSSTAPTTRWCPWRPRDFVERLRAGSDQPVVYAELPRAQHALDVFPSVRAQHTVHAVERFLAVVRSRPAALRPGHSPQLTAAPRLLT